MIRYEIKNTWKYQLRKPIKLSLRFNYILYELISFIFVQLSLIFLSRPSHSIGRQLLFYFSVLQVLYLAFMITAYITVLFKGIPDHFKKNRNTYKIWKSNLKILAQLSKITKQIFVNTGVNKFNRWHTGLSYFE